MPAVALIAVIACVYAILACIRPVSDELLTGMSAILLSILVLAEAVASRHSQAWWAVGAAGLTGVCYARCAWQRMQVAGVMSASALLVAWFGAVYWLLDVELRWVPLAMLPALAALYVAGDRLRGAREEEVGVPARMLSVSVAGVAAAYAVLNQWSAHAAPYAPCWTTAAYAVAFGAGALHRRTWHWSALSAASASGALATYLSASLWSGPRWAAGCAAGAVALVLIACAVNRSKNGEDAARGIFGVAALDAAVTILVALATVQEPGEGAYAVLAMALSGTVWASLFMLGRGDGYAHAGFAGYLLAYAVFLYDRVSLSQGVLDLYLVPVGVYLLALGHFSDRRGRSDSANSLWWIGLLVILSPTFLAFHTHFVSGGTSLHGILLIVECLAAVGWGIAYRIRSFVTCGTLFALAFATVLGVSSVKQVWAGLIALALGLALLVGVFQLSTRGQEARAWLERTMQEWKRWK